MKDYTKFMKWAVVYFIDRSTQDDKKSKLKVEALFSSAAQAEDKEMTQSVIFCISMIWNDLKRSTTICRI